MTIQEAFGIMLEDKELVQKAGIKDSNRRVLKMKLRNGDETLRVDTMQGFLLAAGFTEASEWTAPIKNPAE